MEELTECIGAHQKLMDLLNQQNARYRIINHRPEGVTAVASEYRGHTLSEAAKSIVLVVKRRGQTPAHVLAVVSGEHRVNLDIIRRLYDGIRTYFAPVTVAENLAGSVSGTVVPFAFADELDLIVDRNLLSHKEIYFNAARLDQSVALNSTDYRRIANPRVESIAQV
ncbi:YbaK/EbsC family protein [Nocardia sp. NPDC051321]|uniref:YbaK/EbsC family protein n=1 Tax=Nocardia sp. NPDC051321 TaxID=3364323 RepID=UPI00379E7346